MSTLENESSNPDKDYDEHAERAIIADLEEIDKIKAELAEWRKGPWVRKADHDELCERFANLAKEYHRSETEIGKLRAAVRHMKAAKGRYHTEIATRNLFDLVAATQAGKEAA